MPCKALLKLLLISGLILLAGCDREPGNVTSGGETAAHPTALPSVNPEPTPTTSPPTPTTAPPTATPSPTPTRSPTQTPLPTQTPIPSPWQVDLSRPFFLVDTGEIRLVDEQGQSQILVDAKLFMDGQPWSPDGTQFIFNNKQEAGEFAPTIANLQTGELKPLTFIPGRSIFWSPDGEKIAYIARVEGQYDLYIVDMIDLTITQLTDDPETEVHAAWSPVKNELVAVETGSCSASLIHWFPVVLPE